MASFGLVVLEPAGTFSALVSWRGDPLARQARWFGRTLPP